MHTLAEQHRAKLAIGRDALQEFQSDIRYLNETLKDTASSDLPEEVAKIVKRVKEAYGIDCKCNGRATMVISRPRP